MALRVLIISNMYPSTENPGYGSFVKDQYQSLLAQGVDCTLIASSESRKGLRYVIPKYIKLLLVTYFAVLKNKYEIIHTHYIFPTAIIGFLASIIRNSLLVITVHGSVEPFNKSYLKKLLIGLPLQKAAHIISVGSTVTNELVKYFSLSQSKISTIDMGVDTDLFKTTDQHKARRLLNLPLENKIILSIGNLIWRKGFHLLIKSVIEYPNAFHNCQIVIIGNGPLKKELTNMVERNNLSDQIHFTDAIKKPEIPLWLSAADCLVHPALDEPFGLVIIEAMSCQTLVIASPVGGIIDYLRDGENGFHIHPWNIGQRNKWDRWYDKNNIRAIAKSVEFALSIPDNQRDLICQNARKTALHHDMKLQANKVKQIYEQLL